MGTMSSLLTLASLGAYHGLSPGMGWLFAVALALQERSGRVIPSALGFIALGHAAAVALSLGLLYMFQAALPLPLLGPAIGAGLFGFGLYKLLRPRHPRWVGMRVSRKDLILWSFLMATAHGAGLMLLPVFLRQHGVATMPCHGPACHAAAAPLLSTAPGYVVGLLVHSGAMFAAALGVALLVFHRVGLMILRRAWLNLDRMWALALMCAGVLSVLLGAR